MQHRPSLLVLLGAVLSLSCATIRVATDFDPEADFSGLEGYAWNPGKQPETGDPRLDNALLDARIRRAVDAHLAARGYRPVEIEEADFIVGYHVAIEGRLDVQTINDYYGYGYGWGWNYGMGPGAGWRSAPETHIREYDEGTLILDISDPETNKLMWRGWAQGELDAAPTPEQREAESQEVVGRILDRFPPGEQKP